MSAFGPKQTYASKMSLLVNAANGRAFLDRLSLAPADMAKFCHGNADKLLKLRVEQ
jgi:hypothetical protein